MASTQGKRFYRQLTEGEKGIIINGLRSTRTDGQLLIYLAFRIIIHRLVLVDIVTNERPGILTDTSYVIDWSKYTP